MVVVNGGVDYTSLSESQEKEKIYDAIYIGRFHPQKGILDLIEIWKLVCKKKPEATLGIMGKGFEGLEDFLNKSELTDNIHILGIKMGKEKYLILKTSKIFLCPSLYESFAIVIAEAMACGLPVVAYDLPIYDSIYENNILKVPIGDVNQFADIVLLLNDPQVMEDLGRKGQEFIQKYDWDKIAEEELDLIKYLMV